MQQCCGFDFKDALEYVANFIGYTEQSYQRNTSIHNSSNVVNLNEIANKLRLGFVQNKQKVISQLGTLFHPNFFEFFGIDKIEKFVGFCEKNRFSPIYSVMIMEMLEPLHITKKYKIENGLEKKALRTLFL